MNNLPKCKYRRSTRCFDFLRLHCFLKRADCTHEDCVVCSFATETGKVSETSDTKFAASRFSNVSFENLPNWIVESIMEERSDLQTLRASLPRPRSGTTRQYTMEVDGSIVYEHEEDEWEPPRDIKGYRRDTQNFWRFTPLWPKCLQRFPKEHHSERRHCFQITMVCTNDDSELNGGKVTYKQCQQCPVRGA